ncbi:MAG: UDP-N-acetylmuramoyl-L-alanyl-D-glutamate--2,6-diaminopimelate ligase [Verrucomicrobia bacterium]|nr:UDP-N-acetylmuramoyl-L-alanyl-D-glutamate--2,6-diaminopimelate ligase [Verrucomicrobiota bacterium]
MERKLNNLIAGLDLNARGSLDIEITGISSNSQTIKPGDLFLARRGKKFDATEFIPQAAAAGAVAVLSDIYNPFASEITQLITSDFAFHEEELIQRFYDYPARKLSLIGITGTNGKTTTSYLLHHLFDPCGLIGTVEWRTGNATMPADRTTPDLLTLTKLFYEMAQSKCERAVMEVSSHALTQGRARSFSFDVAVFTNLTQDHLDYHQTMENYAAAKALLFSSLSNSASAVVNVDDPAHKIILAQCKANVFTYGFGAADLRASDLHQTASGMEFNLHYRGNVHAFCSKLIGRFNVYNILAAVSVGLTQGFSMKFILSKLSAFSSVPGRLERVVNPQGLPIFVDYAHTDDALRNVLETLQECKKGRIITVFGCGGSRDAGKRPKMARAAESLSDVIIVTSDNPRAEDPDEIIRQVLTGITNRSQCLVEVDRRKAIAKAVSIAQKDDIILIAGKGHEKTQEFKDHSIPFDDCLEAKQACFDLQRAFVDKAG